MKTEDKIKKVAKSEREDRQAAAKATIMLMEEKWKAPFVPRSRVKTFTEGLYSPGHLANCDSLGTGPAG